MQPFASCGLDEAFQFEGRKEAGANFQGGFDHRAPGNLLAGIEIEDQTIGSLEVGEARTPRMNLENIALDKREQSLDPLDCKRRRLLAGRRPPHDVAQSRPGMLCEKTVSGHAIWTTDQA